MPILPLAIHDKAGQRKYLTPAEIDKFLAAADRADPAVRHFCWMLAVTGCRISEALAMTVASVDFEAKQVIIRSLKKRGKLIYRAVPLPSAFLEEMDRWFADRPADDARLWPWSRMTGYRRVCEVMEKAQVAGSYACPKGLRHGFGVRAIQANVPLNLVQKWLGHADIKTTTIYTSAMGPEERELASRMWQARGSDAGSTTKDKEIQGSKMGGPDKGAIVSTDAAMPGEGTAKRRIISKLDQGTVVTDGPTSPRFLRRAITLYCPMIQNWV